MNPMARSPDDLAPFLRVAGESPYISAMTNGLPYLKIF
jgi:hypothetical protein